MEKFKCVYKRTKANYFLSQCHQTATKRCNVWHSDWRDKYESAFDLTCV